MGCAGAGADSRRGPWWHVLSVVAASGRLQRHDPQWGGCRPSLPSALSAWRGSFPGGPQALPHSVPHAGPRERPPAVQRAGRPWFGGQHPGRCLRVALSGEFSLQRHRLGGRQGRLFSECLRATGTVGHVLPQFPPAALSKHRWPASWRSPQGCPQHDHPQLTVTLGQGLLRSPLQQNRASTRPQASVHALEHSRRPHESGCTPRARGYPTHDKSVPSGQRVDWCHCVAAI